MTPVVLAHSRAIPVEQRTAFGTLIEMPLTTLFRHRHLLMPPIVEVNGPEAPWGTPGQTRLIHTADRGLLHEELTDVNAPDSFSYRLTPRRGPFRPLVALVEGSWLLLPVGTGTEITWRWTLHPRSRLAAPLVRLIGSIWHGYARRALEQASVELLRGDR